MMFGPWGNNDRAEAIRIIHRALDAGINLAADVIAQLCLEPPAQTRHLPDTLPVCGVRPGWFS
jgi:hypothetical protein